MLVAASTPYEFSAWGKYKQDQAVAELLTGLATAPERMQRVQTLMCLLLLSLVATLIFCKLGNQRRLVLLWAWLTLFPVAGPLPHISHFLAISADSLTDFENGHL